MTHLTTFSGNTYTVKVSYEYMPNQWFAWVDELGEDGSPYGSGNTRQEAIDDLQWQMDEFDEAWETKRKAPGDGVYTS